jgi:hypothetical protein
MNSHKKDISKKRGKPSLRVSHSREEEMERGQIWSVDVLLAVIIFVSVILIFYVAMTSNQKPNIQDLEAEAENIKVEIEQNHEIGFITNDEVDMSKFLAFRDNVTVDYNAMKQKMGVKGDFCLFYEDEGYVVIIPTSDGNKTVGIGSSNISIGGQPCGLPIPVIP